MPEPGVFAAASPQVPPGFRATCWKAHPKVDLDQHSHRGPVSGYGYAEHPLPPSNDAEDPNEGQPIHV
jgi:hypothetical protein